MNRVTGQALAEFALLSFVLVLLVGGLQVIGRVQAIQRQSVLAARHAAFRPAWSVPALPARAPLESLRARHFDNAGWTDPAGRTRLVSADDVGLSIVEGAAPGRAAELTAHLLAPLTVSGGFLEHSFSFGTPGYHVAEVSVLIPPVRGWAPFDRSGIQLTQRAAILGNSWNANGPAQVRARASGLVPTALLREQAVVLRPFTAALSLLEPSLDRLCLGLIEPDRVPADRLLPAPGPLTTVPVCR